MIQPAPRHSLHRFALKTLLTLWLGAALSSPSASLGQPAAADGPGFGAVSPPEEWREAFWKSPSAQALWKLSPKEAADLVPVQAGLRFCRCPSCGASEANDTLVWSAEEPKTLKCRECEVVVPNDAFPAKVNGAVPEEKIEVVPGVWHAYPYHLVGPEKEAYVEERLYLNAKRDYEARAFLSKAAFYAAASYWSEEPSKRDPKHASLARALILRFAQVYPNYADHFDQPGKAKHLLPAQVAPPYRGGYQTGKWEWNGALEVPMNLVLAYASLRDDPGWKETGDLLGCPNPAQTIERDFFLAAAEFARAQPEEFAEDSLHVYRGMLAVGRLVEDRDMVRAALVRIDEFTRRSFYHDGFWRGADVRSHHRVLNLLGGWIEGMLATDAGSPLPLGLGSPSNVGASHPATPRSVIPMVDLARAASSAVISRLPDPQVERASWPSTPSRPPARRPLLLGGAGLARLTVGDQADALDIEIQAQDSLASRHFQRLAFRLSVGGEPILDDLDEREPTRTGWEMATASHNTVVIDGLNQRESTEEAKRPAPGGDFLFFAADPDFQVASVEDRFAYPASATRYRQTFIVSRFGSRRYALSVFEVQGGLQHDQIFHGASGRKEPWRPGVPTVQAPASLLPPSVAFLASAKPEDGRWFVQAYGEFRPLEMARVDSPCQVVLGGRPIVSETRLASLRGVESTKPALRLHILGDAPATLITAASPDAPGSTAAEAPGNGPAERSSLIVRRRSEDGSTLKSTFVTLFEPLEAGLAPLDQVGRVESVANAIVILIDSPEGSEHLIINKTPGVAARIQLANGRFVTTDGLVTRIRGDDVVLAGGTYAEASGKLTSSTNLGGEITGSSRQLSERGRGWFLTPSKLPPVDAAAVKGRTLIVEHGDGSFRSWTIDSIETSPEGTRLHVREEPGFLVDPKTGTAQYYQFPRNSAPGPHRFRIAWIARSGSDGSGETVNSQVGQPKP